MTAPEPLEAPRTRAQTQAETRRALLAAARACFLEHGFHAASVGDIARRAGYTTGALYSNFTGKDDLFLCMLDVELAGRAESQRLDVADAETFEDGIRAAARNLYRSGLADPRMTPVTVEFWIYAADRPELRDRARSLQERQVEWIAEVVDDACRRHGVTLRLPATDVARGGGALSRGVRLERLIDPDGVAEETFVEMFTAYVLGLEEPR